MTDARTFLLQALRRVADGGDIGEGELALAVPDPLVLDRREKQAWEELSHWADDADVRAKDPNYAKFKRAWMRDRIAELLVNGN